MRFALRDPFPGSGPCRRPIPSGPPARGAGLLLHPREGVQDRPLAADHIPSLDGSGLSNRLRSVVAHTLNSGTPARASANPNCGYVRAGLGETRVVTLLTTDWDEPPAGVVGAADAAVVVQCAQRDDPEPEEPRLVEQEVPEELPALVAACPALELECAYSRRTPGGSQPDRTRVERTQAANASIPSTTASKRSE
jgi:hypothetical protein